MEGFDKMELENTQFQISSSEGVQNPKIPDAIPIQLSSLHNLPPIPFPLPIPNHWKSGKNKGVATETTGIPIPRVDYEKFTRRTLANREYYRRHQQKKVKQIQDLKEKAEFLEATILAIYGRKIQDSETKNALLRAENSAIEHKISVMSGELVFKEAQAEELKKERDRLTELFEIHQKQISEIGGGYSAGSSNNE